MPRLFGLICEPSMAQRGVDEWILSLPVTPANPLASQARDLQRKTQGTSGPKSSESSERYSQGLLFSKTSKDISSEDSTESLEICTNWGSMRNGECTQRPKPEHPIGETECSSWPTPSASSYGSNQGGGAGRVGPVRYSLMALAKNWPTPSARDFRSGKASTETHQRNARPLNEMACLLSPLGQKETGAESQKRSGLRLNPEFVTWLMGFPQGWTRLEPWGMPSAPSRQPSQSKD